MKTHNLRSFVLLAAAAVLAGCEQATTPAGTPSEVSVRAYVDRDASGTFTAGDEAIAGVRVTLEPTDGGTSREATTDAQGLARFDAVTPGSYTARLEGGTPEGAELAGAATPVVVTPFEGGAVQAQFRFVYHPGSIEGRLFREGDSVPAPQVLVRLYAGTDTTAAPMDSTRTDAQGAFAFTMLAPGGYTVHVTPPAGITIVDGNARQVTVGGGQQVALPVRFEGSLRIPVIEARTRPAGSTVLVEGVATVGSTAFNGTIYVQDATGGIMAFPASGTAVNAGDSIRVSGPIGAFGQEVQIGAGSNRAVVEVLGAGTLPQPRLTTMAEVEARTYEGRLAEVRGLTVVAVGTASGSGAYSVTTTAASGDTLVVRIQHGNVGIATTSWTVGETYDVVGLLGSFNGVPQLKPRSPADVEVAGAGVMTIAAARSLAGGTEVTVRGVVTVPQGAFRTDNLQVQDATGGILVFGVPVGAGYVVGDSLEVTGAIGFFGGAPQIVSPTVTRLGTGTVPTPRLQTGAEILALTLEGQLVRALNVEVVTVPGGTGGAFTVRVRDAANTEFDVRVSGAGTGLTRASFVVGQRYVITGVLGSFNGTAQLLPRSAADVVPADDSFMTVAAARLLAAGDSVLVRGVVTVPQGAFRTDNLQVQDWTGGILVFGVPQDAGYVLGDSVQVMGEIGFFGGAPQIVSPTVTRLGPGVLPTPRLLTGAQVVARTFEGELVRVNDVEVVTVPGGTGGAFTVRVRDAANTEFDVRVSGTGTGLTRANFVVGQRYDVRGVLGSFNGTAQLLPRSAADLIAR